MSSWGCVFFVALLLSWFTSLSLGRYLPAYAQEHSECYSVVYSTPTSGEAESLAAPDCSLVRFTLRYDNKGTSHDVAADIELALRGHSRSVCRNANHETLFIEHSGYRSVFGVAPTAVVLAVNQTGELCLHRASHLAATARMSASRHLHVQSLSDQRDAVGIGVCLSIASASKRSHPQLASILGALPEISSLLTRSVVQPPLVEWTLREDHAGFLLCCSSTSGSDRTVNTTLHCVVQDAVSLLSAVAGVAFVSHIEWTAAPFPTMAFSRGLVESGEVRREPFGTALGLHGRNFVVGVTDTGIDTDHCFFRDDNVNVPYNTHSDDHRKFVRYQTMGGTDANSVSDFVPGHGTHVAGTVAGSINNGALVGDLPSSEPQAFHGVVPLAKLCFVDLSGSAGEGLQSRPFSELADYVISDGGSVISNSWGQDMGSYPVVSASVDRYVVDSQPKLVALFAAGNEADKVCASSPLVPLCDRFTVLAPSTSKNALSVGASMGAQESWDYADLGNYRLSLLQNGNVVDADFLIKGVAGPRFPRNIVDTPIVLANPSDLCSRPTNSLRGAIAVAFRGTCTFTSKANTATEAGAVALIVVNSVGGHGIIMGCQGDDCGLGRINSFMASQDFGHRVKDLLTPTSESPWTASIELTSDAMPDKNAATLSSFSSHGPTLDLRYKPDLVAVGEMLHSARSDGSLTTNNCDLWASQGTSMATPLVAGYAVMVQEYLARYISPPLLHPSSALVRAILIQAAKPLAGRYERNFAGDWRPLGETPNFEEGHGFPRLESVFYTRRDVSSTFGPPLLVNNAPIENDQVDVYDVEFTTDGPSGFDFEATLVWNDAAGSPLASVQLVNNLDLRVEYSRRVQSLNNVSSSPRFLRYGNAKEDVSFCGTWAYTSDTLNNVEKVRIRNASSGTYRVIVTGEHVASSTSYYSLVASGQLTQTFSTVSHDTPSPLCPEAHSLASVNASDVVLPCGGRGTCTRGACRCSEGWYGASCSTPIPDLHTGEAVTAVVPPLSWMLLHLAVPDECVACRYTVDVVNYNASMADVDVAICDSVPTFATFLSEKTTSNAHCAVLNHEQDNTNALDTVTSPVLRRSFSFSVPVGSKHYYIGVAGMCCYEALVGVTLTAGRTRLSLPFAAGGPSMTLTRAAASATEGSMVWSSQHEAAESFDDLRFEIRAAHTMAPLAVSKQHYPLGGGAVRTTWDILNVDFLASEGPMNDTLIVLRSRADDISVPHKTSYRLSAMVTEETTAASPTGGPPPTTQSVHVAAGAPLCDDFTGCGFSLDALLPSSASGRAFYGDDPLVAPSLLIRFANFSGATWTEFTTTSLVLVDVDSGQDVVDSQPVALDDCAEIQTAPQIVRCHVVGVATNSRYRLDIQNLQGLVLSRGQLTVWISADPRMTSASLLRYTRFANPLVVGYPSLLGHNVSLYIQGVNLLPTVPRRALPSSHDLSDGRPPLDARVNVSLSSASGEVDDTPCLEVEVVSPTLMRCTLPEFPVAPSGTTLLVQMSSTLLYSAVIGFVQILLAPRPVIEGFASRTAALQTTNGRFDSDGSLTVVGKYFPPNVFGWIAVNTTSATGPLQRVVNLTTTYQSDTVLVASLPWDSSRRTFAVSIAGANALLSSFDVAPLLSVDAATSEAFSAITGVTVLQNAETSLASMAAQAHISAGLNASASAPRTRAPYIAITGSQLGLVAASGCNILLVRGGGEAHVCQWKPELSLAHETSSASVDSALVCRVSPYLDPSATYSIVVRPEGSLSSGIPTDVHLVTAAAEQMPSEHLIDVDVDGLPLLVGAPTVFRFRSAVTAPDVLLSLTADCYAPTVSPSILLRVLERTTHSVTVTVDSPALRVYPCVSPGPLAAELSGLSNLSSGNDIFWSAPSGSAPWDIPSVLSVAGLTVEQNDSATGLPVARRTVSILNSSFSFSLLVDLALPVSINLQLSDFISPATADEENIPFFLSLGFEPLMDEAEGAGWTQCNASRVLVYGQADVVSQDNTHFTFSSLTIVGDVLHRSAVLPKAVAICIEVSMQQFTAEMTAKDKFVGIGVLRHGKELETLEPTTAVPSLASSALPSSTSFEEPPSSTTHIPPSTSDLSPCGAHCREPYGVCSGTVGVCQCTNLYRGSSCSLMCPTGGSYLSVPCSGHGLCVLDTDSSGKAATACQCDMGFVGAACDTHAPPSAQVVPSASEFASWFAFAADSTYGATQWLFLLSSADTAEKTWFIALSRGSIDGESDGPITCDIGRASVVVSVFTDPQQATAPIATIEGLFSSGINGTAIVTLGSITPETVVSVRVVPALSGKDSAACSVICSVSIAWMEGLHSNAPVIPPLYRRTVVETITAQDTGCSAAQCTVVYTIVGVASALLTIALVALGLQRRLHGASLLQ